MTQYSLLTKRFPALTQNPNYSFLRECRSFCRREGKQGSAWLFNWPQAGYGLSARLLLCSDCQSWSDHCSGLSSTGAPPSTTPGAGPPHPLSRPMVCAPEELGLLHWHSGGAPTSKGCKVSLKWWGDKQHSCCIPSGTTFNWTILLWIHSGLSLRATGVKCAGKMDLC